MAFGKIAILSQKCHNSEAVFGHPAAVAEGEMSRCEFDPKGIRISAENSAFSLTQAITNRIIRPQEISL